jgi:multimeric flavodoxin WrbA
LTYLKICFLQQVSIPEKREETRMKLLGISASPRKNRSNTFLLLKEVLSGAEKEGEQTEVVHLCDLKIDFCRHCESCHKNLMVCPIKDDAHLLLNKMLESDGIMFASPVYIDNITGYLKTFFDRSTHFIHCQRLLGKYVGAVATAGGGLQQMVLDYIHHYSLVCGAQYVGGVSSVVPVTEEIKKRTSGLGRNLVQAMRNKTEFPHEMEEILSRRNYFRRIIEIHKEEWSAEYDYWREKGWLV